MLVVVDILLSVLFSVILTASFGKNHGQTYFDMIVTGLLFTPLMPLFICLMAWRIDKKS